MRTNCTFTVEQPGVRGAAPTPVAGLVDIPGQRQPRGDDLSREPRVDTVVYVWHRDLPTPLPTIEQGQQVVIGGDRYNVIDWHDQAGRGQMYKLALRSVHAPPSPRER
jgi:hypothetical protein